MILHRCRYCLNRTSSSYHLYFSKALDRNAARIESIYRTLDQMKLTQAMLPKIAAETDYRIVATEKTVAETERLKTGGGSTTTVIHTQALHGQT